MQSSYNVLSETLAKYNMLSNNKPNDHEKTQLEIKYKDLSDKYDDINYQNLNLKKEMEEMSRRVQSQSTTDKAVSFRYCRQLWPGVWKSVPRADSFPRQMWACSIGSSARRRTLIKRGPATPVEVRQNSLGITRLRVRHNNRRTFDPLAILAKPPRICAPVT